MSTTSYYGRFTLCHRIATGGAKVTTRSSILPITSKSQDTDAATTHVVSYPQTYPWGGSAWTNAEPHYNGFLAYKSNLDGQYYTKQDERFNDYFSASNRQNSAFLFLTFGSSSTSSSDPYIDRFYWFSESIS